MHICFLFQCASGKALLHWLFLRAGLQPGHGVQTAPPESKHMAKRPQQWASWPLEIGVSKLSMHVASLGAYSHHPEPWSSSGTSYSEYFWIRQRNYSPLNHCLLSGLLLIWVPLVIELLATFLSEPDILDSLARESLNILEYVSGLLYYEKFLYSQLTGCISHEWISL